MIYQSLHQIVCTHNCTTTTATNSMRFHKYNLKKTQLIQILFLSRKNRKTIPRTNDYRYKTFYLFYIPSYLSKIMSNNTFFTSTQAPPLKPFHSNISFKNNMRFFLLLVTTIIVTSHQTSILKEYVIYRIFTLYVY